MANEAACMQMPAKCKAPMPTSRSAAIGTIGSAARAEPEGGDGKAELEHAAVAECVAKPAAHEHQATVGQHVADHHPLHGVQRDRKGGRYIGQGDVERGVERSRAGAKSDDQQTDPWSGGGHLEAAPRRRPCSGAAA